MKIGRLPRTSSHRAVSPDMLMPPPSLTEAQDYLTRAEEVLQWLLSRL